MKKLLSIISLLLIGCFALVGFSQDKQVYAAESSDYPTKITFSNYSAWGVDYSLYCVFVKLAKLTYSGTIKNEFACDYFSDPSNFATSVPDENSPSEKIDLYNLYCDINDGILDLSTGENARYKVLKNLTLTSLDGIEWLNLSNIDTLILDNHSIETISKSNFNPFPNLTYLSMRNCNIRTVDFTSPALTDLNYLDLSYNNLSEVTLPKMVNYTSTQGPQVYLSNNLLLKAANITLPAKSDRLEVLDVSFNNMKNAEVGDFTAMMAEQSEATILAQGYNTTNTLAYGSEITYIPSGLYPDFSIKTLYSDGNDSTGKVDKSQFYVDGGNNEIAQATPGKITIPAGKIMLQFYNGDTLIEDGNFTTKYYKVAPPTPTIEAYVDGALTTSLSQEKPITIKVQNTDENIEVYYSICSDGTNYSTPELFDENGIEFKDLQTYKLEIYAMYDGIQTVKSTFTVSIYNHTWILIILIILVSIIVVGFAVWVILRWYREGGVVAPLSEKEIDKLNKKGYDFSYDKDSYIDDLNSNESSDSETIEINDNNDDYIDNIE